MMVMVMMVFMTMMMMMTMMHMVTMMIMIMMMMTPAASESQLDEAQLFMERTIMSHIYTQALFPNGDGDILRDR